ncbi:MULTISPECIES: ABC transporter substrate-binding protein [unclassified Ruegeria]|uniref:ABC transporter substrate-binding protein n=1 Tax=unclassified Ruegeria TaxID=2625375 RepID=UPI001ADC9D2F|nr:MULTISPECIES: ABC transporter substrate-binding protein [unclassified Ruegeria]MBO9413558.1 ABC transporter substrate-binding protein [Ruegeria sp. R8_1]MBO9417259.1 ABC transporter substrate-binding protein [Ruegeria sp. R8_2]
MTNRNKNTTSFGGLFGLALGGVVATAGPVLAEDTFKMGIITFLSGPAAGSVGIPQQKASELLIEAINAGSLPAPYDTPGIGGQQIEAIYVDENSKQKSADYKKLVNKDGVSAIVGYVSSGNCKAMAPLAEEEKALTVFSTCGTPQVYEEVVTAPEYSFRTISHATSDSVGAARYVAEIMPGATTLSGINQNYAWGQDSWRDFSQSVTNLNADLEIVNEQFPKVFAGQYGSEITSLLSSKAQLVHTSFWGGDLEAFVLQGTGRGLFREQVPVLTVGDTIIDTLGDKIPDGAIIGARGPYGVLAPDNALNDWLKAAYQEAHGVHPNSAVYQQVQAILAVKAAADKAGSADPEAIRQALKGLTYDSPAGPVEMGLSNGHQAVLGISYGTYKFNKDTGAGTVENIRLYPASCVNPPKGVGSIEWVESGLEGAVCN